MAANIKLKLARRLRQLRRKRGLTQEELAGRAGVDYKQLQRLEGRNPSAARIDTLDKVAGGLGISLKRLFDF